MSPFTETVALSTPRGGEAPPASTQTNSNRRKIEIYRQSHHGLPESSRYAVEQLLSFGLRKHGEPLVLQANSGESIRCRGGRFQREFTLGAIVVDTGVVAVVLLCCCR